MKRFPGKTLAYLAFLITLFSSGISPTCTCKPCPENLVGDPGKLPCYLSVRSTEEATHANLCRHCDAFILGVDSTYIHLTFPKMKAGYTKCIDHKNKCACEESSTVAEPKNL